MSHQRGWRDRARRHTYVRRRGAAVTVALAAPPLAAPPAPPVAPAPPAHASGPAPLARATISLIRGARAIPLPRSFFGFSIEVWDAMHDARYLTLFTRAVDLVPVPGDGTQALRTGRNSTTQ